MINGWFILSDMMLCDYGMIIISQQTQDLSLIFSQEKGV
jgi:hypothetical protein